MWPQSTSNSKECHINRSEAQDCSRLNSPLFHSLLLLLSHCVAPPSICFLAALMCVAHDLAQSVSNLFLDNHRTTSSDSKNDDCWLMFLFWTEVWGFAESSTIKVHFIPVTRNSESFYSNCVQRLVSSSCTKQLIKLHNKTHVLFLSVKGHHLLIDSCQKWFIQLFSDHPDLLPKRFCVIITKSCHLTIATRVQ